MYRTHCLICNSTNLTTIMDLGLHPFADTFLKDEDLEKGETVFPLVCDLCGDCGQVQLKCATDPNERYVNHDYSYTSANSAFSRKHWEEYAQEVAQKTGLGKGLVVEIGSNDGYLTEQFRKLGNPTLGVDPSPVMATLAKERGVDTIIALFGTAVGKKILQMSGKAELVVANNVFNHSDNPVDFVKAVAEILDENGTFVFELPYWHSTIQSKKFDQIYHEHVSYFTVTSSEAILKQAGLQIWSAEVVNYHGGSLRVYAKHNAAPSAEAERLKEEERSAGLFDPAMYGRFMQELHTRRTKFLEEIYAIRNKGGTIIAVGAAAKGNTLLNFYNLDHKSIAYVTDVSEHKQGKYTPYTRIPIRSDNIFGEFDAPYALILAWNLPDGLKKALLAINPEIRFITPWVDT